MDGYNKYDNPLGLVVPTYFSVIILLLGVLSKKVLHFCVPIIAIMFLCFLFYACIIRPLRSKEKVKNLGYLQCMIKWLLDAMLYKYVYLKVVTLCCITSIIFERFILQLFIDVIFGLLVSSIIITIVFQMFDVLRILSKKKTFIFEYNDLPLIYQKIISILNKKFHKYSSVTQTRRKDHSNED